MGESVTIGEDICLDRDIMNNRFDLLCAIQDVDLDADVPIRTSLPTPNRTWTTDPNDFLIYTSPTNEDAEIDPGFYQGNRILFSPGLPAEDNFRPGPQGSLQLSVLVTRNLTSAVLPDSDRLDAPFLSMVVFDELLGTYTCRVENVYGFDEATTRVTECGKQ